MIIENFGEKSVWEDFVLRFSPNNFLTSWVWGDFNYSLGQKIFRLALLEDGDLSGVCLAIEVKAKRGSFLLCPAGPLLETYVEKKFQLFHDKLTEIARREKLNFVRLRPLVEKSNLTLKNFQNLQNSPVHVHAQVSWLLRLGKNEEQLLADMRKTTRYLIRQAEKTGVLVEQRSGEEGLTILEALQKETVSRHQFVPFSREYLEKELAAFGDRAKILTAFYEGKPLAAAFIIFWGESAFYHHGASI